MECVTEIDANELCVSGDVATRLLSRYLPITKLKIDTQFSIKFIELLSLQEKSPEELEELLVKYLTPEERVNYERSKAPLYFLAKRIAAKIAFMEIYSGEAKFLYNQIKIENDEKGCPYFYMKNRIPGYALSLSDEANMVAVFCCRTSTF